MINKYHKILIIGSAPTAKNWLSNNHKKIRNIDIAAINNAWALIQHHKLKYYWYHSTDYKNKLYNITQDKSLIKSTIVSYDYIRKPIWITPKTMLCDTLCDLYNRFDNIQIGIIGCDLNYSNKVNHFYGKGTPDPLRIKNIDYFLNEIYKSFGDRLTNLSNDKCTRLPFRRKKLSEFLDL